MNAEIRVINSGSLIQFRQIRSNEMITDRELIVATKSYWRVYENMTEGMEAFFNADRMFDCGEWSDGFHDDVRDKYADKATKIICETFGISPNTLHGAIERIPWEQEQLQRRAMIPWEPWTDAFGKRHHGRLCDAHHERGLNCSCIPESEIQRMKVAVARGDSPDSIIDPGWGQF